MTGRARIALAFDALVVLVAFAGIVRIVLTFAARLPYPYDLEWMEGAFVDHVRVLQSGQPLYRAPSVEFTPFIYTPLSYVLGAGFSKVVGTGVLAPRLVSVVSWAGVVALVWSFVRRETGDRLAAIAGASWFVATYELSGYWFDLARADCLALAFALAATWLARFGRGRPSAIGAGVLMALAFFSKQSAVALLPPMLAFAWTRGRKHAASSAIAFVVPTVVAVAWLDASSGGWFRYYVFDLPSQHDLLWDRWQWHLVQFFVKPVAIPLLLAVGAFIVRPGALASRGGFVAYAVFLGVVTAGSYLSLLKDGAASNVLIPFHAVLGIGLGIGYAGIRRKKRAAFAIVPAVAWLVAIASIAVTWHAVPTREDREANDAMLARIEKLPGPVLVLGTGNVAVRTGRSPVSAHTMAMADVFRSRDVDKKRALREALVASIRDERWAVIVVDRSFELLPPDVTQTVHEHYRREGSLYPPLTAGGWPKTGFRTRPEEIWARP